MTKKSRTLYIHIPFCHRICSYCDFTKSLYNEDNAKKYIDILLEEFDSYNIKDVTTIYIGGGTPTALSDELFEKLLSHIRYLVKNSIEYTIESNVECLSKNKLDIMKRLGVNRLSIGVQSFDETILESLNRNHRSEDIEKRIKLAKSLGFNNINIDLIYGLPHSTLDKLKDDLNKFIKLDIEHISTYSLTVNKGTKFYVDGIKEIDDDQSREYYDMILSCLREHGFIRYEVSNFAKPGYESKHNLTYWHDEEYYGLGLGASGYLNGVRYDNTKNLHKYLRKEFIANREKISKVEDESYYLMLNLRLGHGFSKNDYRKKFGHSFINEYRDKIDSLIKKSLLVVDKSRVYPTDEGIMLLDYLLAHLL